MIYWIIPSWIISLALIFYAGYKLRDLTTKIEIVQEVLKEKVDKKAAQEEPHSTLIDLTDPIKEAQYEHEKLMKRLNPDD